MRIDGLVGGATNAAGTSSAAKSHARLADAAQQFEGMLLQEMLKPMQSSKNVWNEGDDGEDKSTDTMTAYGVETVAKAISKAGGLGIAKQVLRQVELEGAGNPVNSAPTEKGMPGTKVF